METQVNDGAYVLRELLRNVPLSADGEDDQTNIYITCVEAWEGNLYVGTSAAEILHFVSLPSSSPESDQPTYILASRLQPEYSSTHQTAPGSIPGVEQILVLPSAAKACILCNGTLTFYTLPELSPAYGGKIKQSDCTWVGGIDRDLDMYNSDPSEGCVIMICLKQRLRVIRIGDRAVGIRAIEMGACLNIQRRGDLACVADGKSYALLDIVNQRKIDLFPISSSAEEPESRGGSPDIDPPRSFQRPLSRSFSSVGPARRPDLGNQDRVASVGGAPQTPDRLRPGDSPSPWPKRTVSRSGLSPSPTRPLDRPRIDLDNKPVPTTPQTEITQPPLPPLPAPSTHLIPHVATPTPNEFLLTTGTSPDDPAVGMFVNLDGDVVRGTVQFTSYPDSLVVDGNSSDPSMSPMPGVMADEGYVLAVVRRERNGIRQRTIEYQRWDVDPTDNEFHRDHLDLPLSDDQNNAETPCRIALREATTASNLSLPSVGTTLSLRRLHLHSPTAEETESDSKRNEEEDQLIGRFANVQSRILLFAHDSIWWLVRNPLVVQLESRLSAAVKFSPSFVVQRDQVEKVVNSIRGLDASNEFEFLGFNYIRQQASLLLLIDLILKTNDGVIAFEHDKRSTHDALTTGEIDPRIILSIIPVLSDEVVEGPQGIWVPGGLRTSVSQFKTHHGNLSSINQDAQGPYGDNLLGVLKHYLVSWRRKKGFGSIADEKQVFWTVDAALLSLLLMLDAKSPKGPATVGSLRAELNDVVDHGVECFDRAVELLERHKRLYVLSRLYQSRKMVGQVLATWRRIIEGEADAGGEMTDGETDLRKYVARIKDKDLVKEYGTWLANRNPKLGVQVFADENSRVRFEANEAVELLKEKAPAAVKEYLEYLVFGKNQTHYVNDLISFYLTTVTTAISDPETSARTILLDSYLTYRALTPPKPTYRAFITDNHLPTNWWSARLRLLQLIGSTSQTVPSYSVQELSSRLEPYSSELVPEMIILNGRRGAHVEALRLLVHGLGDYDTAIRYCLLGGSNIFHISSSSTANANTNTTTTITTTPQIPSKQQQITLFNHLLRSFLDIEDIDARRERTSELLERFGSWFDVAEVLPLLPADWPLQDLSGFLGQAVARLVKERNETVVVRALVGSQNLGRTVEVVEKVEKMGPQWESVKKDSGVA